MTGERLDPGGPRIVGEVAYLRHEPAGVGLSSLRRVRSAAGVSSTS
jgi:hypothetical protein